MNYFIYWLKPEVMAYYKEDEQFWLFVPYFHVWEGELPFNYFDQRTPFTTAN